MTPDGPGLNVSRLTQRRARFISWPGDLVRDGSRNDFQSCLETMTKMRRPSTRPRCWRRRQRYPGWRVGRTNRVLEALIPAILEQKVTGKEAWLGWRTLIRQFGEPPPSGDGVPQGLQVVPSVDVWGTDPLVGVAQGRG